MFVPRAQQTLNSKPLIRRIKLAPHAFLLAILLSFGLCALGQQPTPTTTKVLRLGKIEVSGLERYTQEQVVAASGLQLGQPIDIPAADEAANRLMNSGLFKTLSYRFRSAGDQVTVTFEVVEAKESAKVVFDNFVWFSDEELTEAIRREVPTFDGTAPEAGDLPDRIKKALQTLLNDRKITGHVEYLSEADAAGKNASYLFSVKGVKIPVCTLLFPGAKDVKESELVGNSKPLFQSDYSRGETRTFARVNLIPIYRQRGHLRASFLEPEVKRQQDDNCSGVSVTMQVDEGPVYTWDKADWSGNAILSAQELSAALGMKTGERADGLKIDKGRSAVAEAYGKRGYLDARVGGSPEFDDANRRVGYRYTVTEGPQYRMGTLEINGLPENLTERVKESWKLLPGDAFDTSYYDTFLKKAAMEIGASGLRLSETKTQYKPDRERRIVNVVIDFK